MGTISQKLEYLNTTKGKIKDSINITGANIGANDTFRSYSTKLKDGIVDMINNGTDTAYNNFPKVSGTGSDITLNDTYNSKLKVDLKGNTYQDSYTGKNKFNIGTGTSTAQTVQVIKNGSEISFNGTANASNYLFNNISLGVFQAGTYTISIIKKSGSVNNSNDAFIISDGSTNYCSRSLYNIPFNTSFTLTENTELFCKLWSVSGMIYTNCVINIQLEKNTTATSYEPYVGGNASPNPDYPQDIEVVTGYNEIEVVGKNLLDYTKSVNGSIATKSTSEELSSSSNAITSDWILCKPNTSYTISGGNNRKRWQSKDINGNITYIADDYTTITTNSTARYLRVYYYYLSSGVNPQSITDVMINEGSSALNFEPYQGQSYEINLGKNLFDKSNMTWVRNNDGDYHNTANNNTTRIRTQNLLKLEGGKTYTISGIPSGISVNTIKFYANTSSTSAYSYVTTATFSVPTEASYVIFQFGGADFTDATNTLMANADIQVEEGQSTPFSPYKTPIEMCEIGNYQDYIYKENDTWYKYSEIGKVILDGSETYTGVWWDSTTPRKGARVDISNALYPTDASQYLAILGDKYTSYSQEQLYRDTTFLNYVATGICIRANNSQLIIKNNNLTLSSDTSEAVAQAVKSWVTTNGLTVYYVLSTPTVTILDNELQNQLNALESANSYLGQTNITAEYISGNQPFDMSVSALLKE